MKKFLSLSIHLLFYFSLPVGAQVFYKDVAGSFNSSCLPCHRDCGGAPFSVRTYSDIANSGQCPNINLWVSQGKMPPWPPDTTYSRFRGERLLSQAQRNKIVQWTTNGCPMGDTTQAPWPPPAFRKYKLCGVPSQELQIPSYTVTSNSDMYNCFVLPTNLTQDRWIRAYELVPGNADIVHHVLILIDTTGTATSDLSGNCFNVYNYVQIGTYAPGTDPMVLPSTNQLKAGMRIKAGSKIVLQVHYGPGSQNKVDNTKLRLYYYPVGTTGIRQMNCSVPLQNWNMSIAPNTTQTYSASFGPLPTTLSVYAVFPHSHMHCDSLRVYADFGSNVIKLVRIKEWDFHFQSFYYYRKMKRIPAGYTLRSQHTYTNNTNQTIVDGESTMDEMLFDGFLWMSYAAGDTSLDINALLANDSLLSCSSPPFSDFGVTSDTVCVGDCLDFMDMSSNFPTSWNWNFPGANISSSLQQNPQQICYSAPGTYTVSMTAQNANGCDWGCGGCLAREKRIVVQVCSGMNDQNNEMMVSAFPNPFAGTVQLSCKTSNPRTVNFEIYDVLGNRLNVLSGKSSGAGIQTTEWDGTNAKGDMVSPGLYYFSVRSENKMSGGKILMINR